MTLTTVIVRRWRSLLTRLGLTPLARVIFTVIFLGGLALAIADDLSPGAESLDAPNVAAVVLVGTAVLLAGVWALDLGIRQLRRTLTRHEDSGD